MFIDSPLFLFVILVISGLAAWFGTRFIYDLFSNFFIPVEPEKQPLNENPFFRPDKPARLIKVDLESNEKLVQDPRTGINYIETTTFARGGRGNPKLLQFTSYEKREEI